MFCFTYWWLDSGTNEIAQKNTTQCSDQKATLSPYDTEGKKGKPRLQYFIPGNSRLQQLKAHFAQHRIRHQQQVKDDVETVFSLVSF